MDNISAKKVAETIRDTVHNLDLSDKDSQKAFKESIKTFLIKLEDNYREAYDDRRSAKDNQNLIKNILASGNKPIGNVSVGIGFNMDAGCKKGGREEWDKVMTTSFDDVYYGRRKLTVEEVDRLFDYSLDTRIAQLKRIYKSYWAKLRPNEQIGIISPYFNGRKVVNGETNFYKNIILYAKTKDKRYLLNAVEELRERSNKEGNKKARREAEATLLDSTECPFYVVGTEKHLPDNKVPIYEKETRIPRCVPCSDPTRFEDFFVWRTQMDDRVRPDHWLREGMVFNKYTMLPNGMPGCDYGCRCYAEPVPDVEGIIEFKIRSLRGMMWIRNDN